MAKLIAMAGERNALVFGRNLTKTKDGQSVSYAKALEALAPGADLTPWTTAKKGSWRLY